MRSESTSSVRKATAGSSDLVRLNVGGKIFETTRQALLKEPNSFFARLFDSNTLPSVKDSSGAYMIARTPDHMETILNFLQHGFVSVGDRSLIPELLEEVDFYGLANLKAILEGTSKESTVTERVSVVLGEWKTKPAVLVILPTSHADYDVLKALKREDQLSLYFVKSSSRGALPSGGFWTASKGPQTFFIIRNHVTKVVTELGFRIESERERECTFVRNVGK